MFLLFISCKNQSINIDKKPILQIEKVLVHDSLSIRALVSDKQNNKIWFAGTSGYLGSYDFKTQIIQKQQLKFKTIVPHFRSIGQNATKIFAMCIESPGLLFSINKKTLSYEIVYTDYRQGCFFDSLQFWNNLEGIAVADPIDAVFNVIITKDGGKTWTKITNLPKAFNGEAHFAASNSCISVFKNHAWIFTGGKASRVFHTSNKGTSWEVFKTPIIAGKTMTGIFSGHFYNDKIGCIAGGDYENQEAVNDNIAFTNDGGKTWNIKKTNINLGYISCIQFMPNGKGQKIVAVAANGLYYSEDAGLNWYLVHQEKDFYTISFLNENQAIMAGKNKIVKIVVSN